MTAIKTDYKNAPHVVNALTTGKRCLILLRGLPGTGKTRLANQLRGRFGIPYAEADDFFLDKDGSYKFRPNFLPDAHAYCRALASRFLFLYDRVVVSNTNLTNEEIRQYKTIARKYKVELIIVNMTHEFGSIHKVPENIMNKMREHRTSYKIDIIVEHESERKGGAQ